MSDKNRMAAEHADHKSPQEIDWNDWFSAFDEEELKAVYRREKSAWL